MTRTTTGLRDLVIQIRAMIETQGYAADAAVIDPELICELIGPTIAELIVKTIAERSRALHLSATPQITAALDAGPLSERERHGVVAVSVTIDLAGGTIGKYQASRRRELR